MAELLHHWAFFPAFQALCLVIAIQLPWYLPIRYHHLDAASRYLVNAFALFTLAGIHCVIFPELFRLLQESRDTPSLIELCSTYNSGGRITGFAAFLLSLVHLGRWGEAKVRSVGPGQTTPSAGHPIKVRIRSGVAFFSLLTVIFGVPHFFSNSAFTRISPAGVEWKPAWALTPELLPYSSIKHFEGGLVKIHVPKAGFREEFRIQVKLLDDRVLLVRESHSYEHEWVRIKTERLRSFLASRKIPWVDGTSTLNP